MKSEGLPPSHRVRHRRDFEKAYDEGTKVVTPSFALFARPNGLAHSRLGVTATRRLGRHVRRNRARRVVKEAYRKHRREYPRGFDYVVVVRDALLKLSPEELAPVLVRAAREAAGDR